MIAPGESRFQNLVNSLEEGTGQFLIRGLLAFAIVTLLAGAYSYTQFRGLSEPEAMRMAALAANLARGNGFSSGVVDPADIGFLNAHDKAPERLTELREIARPPAFPVLLSALMWLVDPNTTADPENVYYAPEIQVVLPMTFLFAILAGGLVYMLGTQLFNPRVGLLALAGFFLSKVTLDDGISGLPLTLEMLCAIATFTLVHAGGKRLVTERGVGVAWTMLALSAVCCAVGILTSYAMAALVPAIMILLLNSLDRRRYPALGVWLLLVALLVAPWLIRNVAVSGHAFGSAPHAFVMDTRLFPADTLSRTLVPDIDPLLAGKAVEHHMWAQFAALYTGELWAVGGGLLFALVIASYLYQFVRHDVSAVHWAFAAAVVSFLFVAALSNTHDGRILHALMPIGIVLGMGFLHVLLDQFGIDDPFRRAVVMGSVLVLHGLPMALTMITSRPGIPYPPYYPPLIQQVAGYTEDSEIICTDIPEAVAWYGSRTALRLPMSVDEFYRIHDEEQRISALYLTPVTGGRPYIGDLVDGPSSEWLPILNRQVPEDFPLSHGISLPRGSIDQILLSDRPRWRASQ